MNSNEHETLTLVLSVKTTAHQELVDALEDQSATSASGVFGVKCLAERRLWQGDATISLVLSFSVGVASKVVASWIYDKLKGRATEIKYRTRIVECTPEGLLRIVEEVLSAKR
jgi:hypothetical protein